MPAARVNDDIEIAWESFGDGPPVLLVMGIGAQMILWHTAFCEALAERGFRVIRYDHRDVGASTHLTALGYPPFSRTLLAWLVRRPELAPYTLRDMAGDAVGLLDALDIERAHVVGASMGGMIAQELAIGWPDRVASLVSIMSSPGRRRDFLGDPRATLALLRRPERTREGYAEHGVELFRVLYAGELQEEDVIRDLFRRSYDRETDPTGFLRQFAAIMATPARVARLRDLDVPTLVMHGTADPLLRPRSARATADAIPGSRLRWIEGMGHGMPRKHWPELIDAIVEHCRSAGHAGAGDEARATSKSSPTGSTPR